MQRERTGELLMLAFSLFESWFPIVTILMLQHITPVFAYAFTLLFSIPFFLSLVIYRGKLSEFLCQQARKDLLLTAFLITTMFAVIFIGLKYTTAGNMAVIIFLQLFFSYLYFNVLGREHFFSKHFFGALLMGSGAILILFPEQFSLNKGDLLILLAAAIAPIANKYQQRARQHISSETILAFRSIAAVPVLFLLAYALEPIPDLQAIQLSIYYIAVNGLLLMGFSKLFWVEALHRISITKASAMAALMPVFTIFFAYLTLDEKPALLQLMGVVPVLAGGYLITRPRPLLTGPLD